MLCFALIKKTKTKKRTKPQPILLIFVHMLWPKSVEENNNNKKKSTTNLVDVSYCFQMDTGDATTSYKALMPAVILATLNFVCCFNHFVDKSTPEHNFPLI